MMSISFRNFVLTVSGAKATATKATTVAADEAFSLANGGAIAVPNTCPLETVAL